MTREDEQRIAALESTLSRVRELHGVATAYLPATMDRDVRLFCFRLLCDLRDVVYPELFGRVQSRDAVPEALPTAETLPQVKP